MKTLKAINYKGRRVYIRHIYGDHFEFLIPWDNQIFSNVIRFTKPRKHYKKGEEKAAVDALLHIAQTFIDTKQRSFVERIKSFLTHGRSNQEQGSVPGEEPRGSSPEAA